MKRARMMAAGLVCGILATVCGAKAAPLDDRIPADAVVYTGWAGTDALAPKYAGSNLKGLMDNTKIGDYVRENWDGWMEKARAGNAEGTKEMEDALVMSNILWHHPTAIYVGPTGLADIKNPTFKGAFLCDAGKDAPALEAWYKRMMLKNPPPADMKMKVAVDGTVVIVAIGDVTPEAFMNGGAGNGGQRLPASPAYTGAMTGMQKDPAIAIYIDAAKIIGTIAEAVEKAPDAPAAAKKNVPIVLQALGLTSITQIGYAGGFQNKGWTEQAFVGVHGPRVGLLTLLETGPVSDAALAMVPKDAASMNMGRFDLAKALVVTRDVIGKVDPKALEEFNKGLAAGGKELGIDLEKDFFNALGDEFAGYRGPPMDDGSHPFVMLQKLRDPAAFGQLLAAVEKQVNEKAAGKLKIEKLDAGKFEVTGIRLPQVVAGAPSSFAWTIRNGIFYFSNVDGIGSAVEQVEAKGESITASAGYKTVMAALPQVKPTAITYSEPAKLYPELYRSVNGLLPMGRLAGLDLPADLLPMPKKVAEFLPPGGSVTWSDADGFHFAGTSAFPGAEALSGQVSPASAVGVTAMAVGVMLPSLGKARELANRSYSAANLRGIAQSCIVWSAENNDKMPDDVATLILSNQISAKQLVSKRAGTEPLVVTEAMLEKGKTDFDAFAKEVDAHSDYVYLGKGTTNTTDASVVLAYEKPGPNITDGINLVFMDAHAEFVRWANLPEAFKATNDYRNKQNLPVVDVDALLKLAPGAH